MSHTLSIEQAAARLSELIGDLKPGDEIVLTRGADAVVRILPSQAVKSRRRAGSCRGMLIVHQEDDEHLKDFTGYMP